MASQIPEEIELQHRLAELFPSEEESRRELAAAVSASGASLPESLAALFLLSGMGKKDAAAVLRDAASAVLEREVKLDCDFPDGGSQLQSRDLHLVAGPGVPR